MPLHTRLRPCLLAALLSGPSALADAQVLVAPSAHFGASMYPDPFAVSQLGVHFDRFTRFGKEKDNAGNFTFEPYNEIPETIGLNFLAYSMTRRVGAPAKRALLRVVVQAGYGHNQPTKWAQNTIHDKHDPPLDHVPDSATRIAFDGGVSAELTRWYSRLGTAFPIFASAGAAATTVHHEIFLQTGFRPNRWRLFGADFPFLSGLLRGGAAAGSDGFSRRYIEPAYYSAQFSTVLPFDLWADQLGARGLLLALVPRYERVLSWESGFFTGPDGTPLDEHFISWRFSFYHGLVVVESWNDTVAGKDKGPTGGARLYVRTAAFPLLDRLP